MTTLILMPLKYKISNITFLPILLSIILKTNRVSKFFRTVNEIEPHINRKRRRGIHKSIWWNIFRGVRPKRRINMLIL